MKDRLLIILPKISSKVLSFLSYKDKFRGVQYSFFRLGVTWTISFKVVVITLKTKSSYSKVVQIESCIVNIGT